MAWGKSKDEFAVATDLYYVKCGEGVMAGGGMLAYLSG